ncbi:pyridoxal phosphate-dependent aminotransferase [Sphingomonas sp. 1185]|uniref:pyridoxal phosphate-dependent aminotransferase n=1 Tax=Sphingomonas sp. 1185 TaxID=3156411 RepID=UPI0033992BEC
MKRNLMDDWLVEQGSKVVINLGESSVADISMLALGVPALAKDVLEMKLGNTATRGSIRLRSAIASSYTGIDPADVLVTAGVSEALVAIALAHFVHGANAIVPIPAFHALYDVPELIGFNVRKVDLLEGEGFRLPVDRVIKAIDCKTRLVILNSPHNPTGVVYPAGDIAQIAEAAGAVGATVVVDQHYRFLPRGVGKPADFDALPNVVLLGSIGKCFGCTGLRIGWIVASPALHERYETFKLLLTHSVSAVSEAIAVEILERREILQATIEPVVVTNAARLAEMVAATDGAAAILPDTAGTTAFIHLRQVTDTMAFAQRLLDETGVLILPGESFEQPGFIRVGLGADPASFAIACDALLEAIAGAPRSCAAIPQTNWSV